MAFYPKLIVNNYEIISKIGKGSYGEIFSAKNLINNDIDVLKILKNEKRFEQSNYNELEILKKLRKYHLDYRSHKRELISIIVEAFNFNNHNIIVLKKYNSNLYEEYKLKQFSKNEITKITYDTLRGLDFLKKNKIIHCDLKPENILFYNHDSFRVVICDFSLSIDLDNNRDDKSFLVQSIWYRAPEILFYIDFDYGIDIWSLGCIVFELYFRKPLFTCKTDIELFQKIYCFLGPPGSEYFKSHKKIENYLNKDCKPLRFINYNVIDKMRIYNDSLETRCYDEKIKKFIYKSLTWDNKHRISVEDSLLMFKN